ncbi:MAG: hypothetical protein SGI73_01435 [Chloroflexota bacterium]|nr:hypothetical protein [Chloroflexota bacterium]
MKKLILLVCALWLIGLSVAFAQDGTLTVDVSDARGTISPYVYGANMGLFSLVPVDLMDEAQALHLNLLRFGGNFSDEEDVRKSTLDLFLIQARQMGAAPLLTVRLYDGTPEDAAEIVRYINIEKAHGVRYWSIGNEPNLFASRYNSPYSTDRLNEQWRTIAEAMLAVDPSITLVGPDITQYVVLNIDGETITYLQGADGGAPLDAAGRDWLIEFLRANGDLVDVVSVHRYPWPGLGDNAISIATIDGLRQNTAEWDVSIPNLREVIRRTAGRDIPIAVTEFNSNSSPSCGAEGSLDSFYNAIWVGDALGRFIDLQVEYATYWDIQGIGERCGGLLNQRDMRPSYYAYLMYTHFGTERVASESSDPNVRLYAAQRDNRTLTLMVINLGADETTQTLNINGFASSSDAEIWRFDAEHNAEQIESAAVSDGTAITLPAQSMTVYVVPGA